MCQFLDPVGMAVFPSDISSSRKIWISLLMVITPEVRSGIHCTIYRRYHRMFPQPFCSLILAGHKGEKQIACTKNDTKVLQTPLSNCFGPAAVA